MMMTQISNLLLLTILLLATRCTGQEAPKTKPTPKDNVSEKSKEVPTISGPQESVFEYSKNEKLLTQAYEVFRTNKYLNFKGKDVLIEKHSNGVIKRVDLHNFFGYKKDWGKVENEDTSTLRKNNTSANTRYQYTDNTMTETFTEHGSYGVWKDIQTVYNPKGFVLRYEKKYFVEDKYSNTESIINEYDSQNRVVKVTNRFEWSNPKDNKENVITVKYQGDIVTITSENGIVNFELVKDENSVGYISKLSPYETTEDFRYAIKRQDFEAAKEYCTNKMIKKLEENLSLYQSIIDLKSLGGSGRFGETVQIIEKLELTFKNQKPEKYNATFAMVKQGNGWKIDDFEFIKQ